MWVRLLVCVDGTDTADRSFERDFEIWGKAGDCVVDSLLRNADVLGTAMIEFFPKFESCVRSAFFNAVDDGATVPKTAVTSVPPRGRERRISLAVGVVPVRSMKLST